MQDDRITIDVDPDVADVTGGTIPTFEAPPPPDVKTPLAETVPPDVDEGQGSLPFAEEEDVQPPTRQAQPPTSADPDADLDEPDAPEIAYQRRLSEAEATILRLEIEKTHQLGESEAARVAQLRDAARMKIEDLNFRLEHAQANLVLAEEADDAQAKVKLTQAINDIQNIRSQLEMGLAQTPEPDHIRQQAQARINELANSAPRGTSIAPDLRATNPHAERWATANPWMAKAGPAQDYVIAISQKMMQKGWDPSRPDFYAELSTRVARKFPDIKVASGATPGQQSRQRPSAASPVVGPSRGAAGGAPGAARTTPNRYRFTAAEARSMANMGFDPTNKQHIQAWANERLKSARTAQ